MTPPTKNKEKNSEDISDNILSQKEELLKEGILRFNNFDEFKSTLNQKAGVTEEEFNNSGVSLEDVQEEFEEKNNFEENKKELEKNKDEIKTLPAFSFYGDEIKTLLQNQEAELNNPELNFKEKNQKIKDFEERLSSLKDNIQKIDEAFRVTDMGVDSDFVKSFGEDIWQGYENTIREGISSGNLDVKDILDQKKEIVESIQEDFDSVQEMEKVLNDPAGLERSIQHLMEEGLTPKDLDDAKIKRFLEAKSGKSFKNQASHNYLNDAILNYKISVEDGFEDLVVENTKEAESKFAGILQDLPEKGFESLDDFKSYLHEEVENKLSGFVDSSNPKLTDSAWDNLKKNFMIPNALQAWQGYLDKGENKINKTLDDTLQKASEKEFSTKEELVKFIQETTGPLGQEKLLPNDIWDEKIADVLHGKVDLLWEAQDEKNKESLDEVFSLMRNVKLPQDVLLSAKPKTEEDFMKLAKQNLKTPKRKISDEVWDKAIKAEFEPNVRKQISENTKIMGSLMSGMSFLDSKTASECRTEAEYIRKFQEKFSKEMGLKVFGIVPDNIYDALKSQKLVLRGRQGWLESQKEEKSFLLKAKGALNSQNLIKTVHHFVKSKRMKNPSVEDFLKSSTKALISQFGLTPKQAEMIQGDLRTYAGQAKQEFSRRKSLAQSEVNRYGNDLSKINFTLEDLNDPVNFSNPQSSGFYKKMVAGLGDMKFSDVNDWYLVQGEAMGKIEGMRQEQLKLHLRENVLNDNETPDSTISKVKSLMKNISLDASKIKSKPMETEADFFELGKAKLKQIHGKLTDAQWDQQMADVFYPQMKAQLKVQENIVIQSMRNAPLGFTAEDLSKVSSEEAFTALAEKSYRNSHGGNVFGRIPNSNYDKIKANHFMPRVKKLWKSHQEKVDSGKINILDDSENAENKDIPKWAESWGMSAEDFGENMEMKGSDRMSELLNQSSYGLDGLDTSHKKTFGKLLINLLSGLDKNKFDLVKTALNNEGLSGFNNPKDKFIHLTKTLLTVGFGSNENDVKNIVAMDSGTNSLFNNFFGTSIADLQNSQEISEDLENLENPEIEDEESLEEEDKDNEDSENNLNYFPDENMEEDLIPANDNNSGGQNSGNQDDGDLSLSEENFNQPEINPKNISEDLDKDIPANLEKKSEEKNIPEVSAEAIKIPETEIKLEDNSDLIQNPEEIQAPETDEVLMDEIILDEAEKDLQEKNENNQDEVDKPEENLNTDLEEILEDTDDNVENPPQSSFIKEEVDGSEISDEFQNMSLDDLKKDLDIFEEEDDLEEKNEDLENPPQSSFIKEEVDGTENLDDDLENNSIFEDSVEEKSEIIKPKIKTEKISETKEEEEEVLETVDNVDYFRESVDDSETQEDENQGSQQGQGQKQLSPEEIKLAEITQKLKNKELAGKIMSGGSLVLLSEEDQATIFNSSHEWDLSGDVDLTILQIIQIAHKTVEVMKGGKNIPLTVKLSVPVQKLKIKNFEVLQENFISTATKIQNLKSISVESIRDGRLMGFWITGFGNIPFRIKI